jgi:hypothetical protein
MMPKSLPIFNSKATYRKKRGREVANDNVPLKTPGSPNTIDEDFNIKQYGPRGVAKNPEGDRAANDNQTTTKSLSRPATSLRSMLNNEKLASVIGDKLSKSALQDEAWVVSAQICWACAPFFVVQIIFWLISILGFAIEFGAYSIGDFFGKNFVGESISELVSSVVPGESIFLLGYIVCTLCALIQLLIAAFLYASRGINPFKGSVGLIYITIAAIYFLIFLGGIAPWGLIWMYQVIRSVDD